MTAGLMHGMRGYARVVLLPVAAAFLSLGAQITCVSAANLGASPGSLLVVSVPHDPATLLNSA